jgi:exodeoxyribonuclease VII large subunit
MDAQARFDAPEQAAWTVSELTARIKQSLETDFGDVYVAGEVSRCTRAASGHVYMTLKDEGAVLSAIIWRDVASRMRFEVEEGLDVIARGSIDVYAPRGSYQLIISEIQPRGLGPLQLAFRQLVEKLEKEGLFDPAHKRPLPLFPQNIGIVTSPTGAAIRDMTNVIFRRWPLAQLYLMPCRVQGEGAADEIAAAIYVLNKKRPQLDLLIVGRGGGSLEDLWAFNEEVVARAIYASRIPVVSAVGHEIDVSISDLVADLRAATPTEAGEKVVPDRAEVMRSLDHLKRRAAASLAAVVQDVRGRLDALAGRHVMRHPEAMLRERAQRTDDVFQRLRSSMQHLLALLGEKVRALEGTLEALSPLKVLDRGYSITFAPDGAVLRSVEGLTKGDAIRTRVLRGEIESAVQKTTPMEAPTEEEGQQ